MKPLLNASFDLSAGLANTPAVGRKHTMTSTHHHHPVSMIRAMVLRLSTVMIMIELSLLISPGEGSPFESIASPSTRGCPESYKKFEIMSGFAFSSPPDSFASIPVTLMLLFQLWSFYFICALFCFAPRLYHHHFCRYERQSCVMINETLSFPLF